MPDPEGQPLPEPHRAPTRAGPDMAAPESRQHQGLRLDPTPEVRDTAEPEARRSPSRPPLVLTLEALVIGVAQHLPPLVVARILEALATVEPEDPRPPISPEAAPSQAP